MRVRPLILRGLLVRMILIATEAVSWCFVCGHWCVSVRVHVRLSVVHLFWPYRLSGCQDVSACVRLSVARRCGVVWVSYAAVRSETVCVGYYHIWPFVSHISDNSVCLWSYRANAVFRQFHKCKTDWYSGQRETAVLLFGPDFFASSGRFR
jgi:hypothetical protein